MNIKSFLSKRAVMWECLLIFFTCVFIYLANGQRISSNDSVPNSLLALQWLENHTLHFDAFRGGDYYMSNDRFGANGIPYFFVEAPNGHLTSAYPIGVAIVSFPIYFIFFVYLKLSALIQSGFSDLSALTLHLTDATFKPEIQAMEKLVGTLLTAFTVVIFYLLTQLKFGRAVAIIATFIYAFATLNWAVSSQGLWQHTVSNLALLSVLLCLFKANRTEGSPKQLLLFTAGIWCGFLPGIRPTSLLFSAAILIYALFTYRKDALFLLLGSLSALLNISWNVYYFGLNLRSILVGGYSSLFGHSNSAYTFDPDYFREAFWGMLISPSRGIFIFSPILLFIIPGIVHVFRHRNKQDERLIFYLTIVSLILFIHYCFYIPWWGAITYGSRFLVDLLPILCYLVCYFLVDQCRTWWQRSKPQITGVIVVFLVCLTFSTFTEVVGVFSDPAGWDTSPTPHHMRFWDWQDNQISRHTKNLYLKLNPPIAHQRSYVRQLNGTIEKIKDANHQPLAAITAQPLQEVILQADLSNTGRSKWYGYDTGLLKGRTIVKVEFLNSTGQKVNDGELSQLFVQGIIPPDNPAMAIGCIRFPQQPGEYTMLFKLAAARMRNFPGAAGKKAYELKATVGM